MESATRTAAFIGLGSNLGDGKKILQEAWRALGRVAGIRPERLSGPYMTAPVGMESEHWFTNAVGCLTATLPPRELLQALMAVEAGFGRVREGEGYQDRCLDLDLLYYGDIVMDSPELILPHPRIGQRLFVLSPFAELEPDFIDPVTGQTIAAMEQRLQSAIVAGEAERQEIVRSGWDDGQAADRSCPSCSRSGGRT